MILQKFEKLGIETEFIDAEDGTTEENMVEFEAYLGEPIDSRHSHPLEIQYNKKMIQSPGAWGYLKTYLKILTLAKEQGYKRILCFDDDVIFHKNFNKEFKKFINSIGNWKLLYLGATQHVWNLPLSHRYSDPEKSKYDPSEPYYHPLITDGSFAIGIDSSIYKVLIDQITLFNCPFDSGPLRHINSLYQEQCYVAQPNLIIADVTESDISDNRDQFELAEKVKWDMELYDFYSFKELVSVIIPAYNAEKTIAKSIESVLNQSYQEIEVIVADDASTDGTVEIVKQFKKRDKRVILLQNNENRGCYFVRNDAIRISKGKYIAIQDSDDISLKRRIEQQVMALIANDSEFTISRIYRSRCRADELDIANEDGMMSLIESRRIANENGKYEYRDRPILGFNSSMFKRSLFEKLGLFWESRFAADAEFCERILFVMAGIRLQEGENIHSFLMDCEPIEGLYTRLDEVLLVSTEMGDNNITNRYSNNRKKEFEGIWRRKFEGQFEYEYPMLNENQVSGDSDHDNELMVLKNKCNILEQKLKVRSKVRDQMLEASRKRILDMENSLAWYDRTYGHLPKWFLKIGGIFRRWPFK